MTQHSSTAHAVRKIIAPLAALALLTAAGCGGGGSANDSTDGSVQPSATASHSSASEPGGDESAAPSGSESGESEAASSGDDAGNGDDGSGANADSGGAGDGDTSGSAGGGSGNGGSGGGGKPPTATLAGIDPCELLTKAQRDELGLPRTTANKKNGETRSCEFNPPQGNGPGTSALLAIHEEEGLKAFSGMTGDAEKTTITGHEAKIQCEYGNCLIGIAITDTSRVDVQSTVLGDDAATKKLGNRIAKMIIGNLGSS